MEDEINVDDLVLAAYLRIEKVPMVRTFQDGHKVYFVFSDVGGRATEVQSQYYDSIAGKRAHDIVREYRICRTLALDAKYRGKR